MSINHLTEHEYAFLNANNVVETITVFASDCTDEIVNQFAQNTGYTKSISCNTYGKPYIGDTWDQINEVWIETATRFSSIVEILE